MKFLRHGWSTRKFVNQWTNEFIREFEKDCPSWAARASTLSTASSDSNIPAGTQGSLKAVDGLNGPENDIVRLLRGNDNPVSSRTGTACGRCADCSKVRWLHGVDTGIKRWTCAANTFGVESVENWCAVEPSD